MHHLCDIPALKCLRRSFRARLVDETNRHLHGSAVVFAPHQDDESLGCGGTIILKRQAGSPVQIVFMTDGSTSHRRFMTGEELRRMRKDEAIRAADKLGVAPSDLHFLEFPDGRLADCHSAAVNHVKAVLLHRNPDEVYVPYHADGTPDHEATFQIVAEAIQRSGLALRVCEYPIWIWNQWPWVPFPVHAGRQSMNEARRVIRSRFGLRFFSEFRTGISIDSVLHHKRLALEEHRSQMTRMLHPDWPTLSSVSGGAFLTCFFQPFEVFHCWNAVPNVNGHVR